MERKRNTSVRNLPIALAAAGSPVFVQPTQQTDQLRNATKSSAMHGKCVDMEDSAIVKILESLSAELSEFRTEV